MEHSPSRLETTEAEANKTTSGKEKDLQDVNAQIQKREGKIEEVQAEIKQLQGEIKQLQGEIKQLQAEIKQLQAKIDAEREKHSPNDETIQELKEREKGLVELRSSYLKQQSTYLTYLNRLLDLFKHVSERKRARDDDQEESSHKRCRQEQVYVLSKPGQIKNPSKKNSVRDTAAKFLSPTIDMGAIEVAKWIARTDIPKDWKAHADTIQNCIAEWAATKDPELNLTAAMAAKMSVMFEDFTVLHQSVISSETEKQKQPRDIAIYSKRGCPVIWEFGVDDNFLQKKSVQGIAYAQNEFSNTERPRALVIAFYATHGVASFFFSVYMLFRFQSSEKRADFGVSRLFTSDFDNPTTALAKLLWCVNDWINSESLHACPVYDTNNEDTSQLYKHNNHMFKWYDNSLKDINEAHRSPLYFNIQELQLNPTIHTLSPRIHLLEYAYLKGNHQLSSVNQALSLVEKLRQLHSKGIVHGDIRLANIVCGEADEAWFIDLDYSGRENEGVYPKGWNHSINDGERHREAVATRQLKREHDYFALWSVFSLFTCAKSEWQSVVACVKAGDLDQAKDAMEELDNCKLTIAGEDNILVAQLDPLQRSRLFSRAIKLRCKGRYNCY